MIENLSEKIHHRTFFSFRILYIIFQFRIFNINDSSEIIIVIYKLVVCRSSYNSIIPNHHKLIQINTKTTTTKAIQQNNKTTMSPDNLTIELPDNLTTNQPDNFDDEGKQILKQIMKIRYMSDNCVEKFKKYLISNNYITITCDWYTVNQNGNLMGKMSYFNNLSELPLILYSIN